MSHLYEGMFLLDNDVVREGWKGAKALVTDLLDKHGASVHSARRWDERPLAYKVKRRTRASYLLCHFDLDTDKGAALTRDLELRESILRHLIVRADEVPSTEVELSRAEESDDFIVPAPPVEQVAPVQDEDDSEDGERDARPERKPRDDEKGEKAEKSEKKDDGKKEGAGDGEAKATGADAETTQGKDRDDTEKKG